MDPADKLSVLLSVYKENADQARHHEQQRERITAIVAQTTGVVLGLLTFSKTGILTGSIEHALVAVFVIMLGILGFWSSWKHNERSRLHHHRIRELRGEMAGLSEIDLRGIFKRADAKHKKDYRFDPGRIRLHWAWKSFHVLIVCLGLALLGVVFVRC